ncbi:hypothetical protein KRX19_01630 [Cardiobacteriaceae bacterium TAE3-ERU3]|nr:hypothetical protein [Cardiobacteriaceae bacterium TAE3-ERU3]
MSIKHILVSLFSLALIAPTHAETLSAPLPENAVRIESIGEADLIGQWRHEEEMADVVSIDRDGHIHTASRYMEAGVSNATYLENLTIRADHTATDNITVDTQIGDTLNSELVFNWAYSPETHELTMSSVSFTESVNGAPNQMKPQPPETTAEITMSMLDDLRILGLNPEYGNTIYYTEITDNIKAK